MEVPNYAKRDSNKVRLNIKRNKHAVLLCMAVFLENKAYISTLDTKLYYAYMHGCDNQVI